MATMCTECGSTLFMPFLRAQTKIFFLQKKAFTQIFFVVSRNPYKAYSILCTLKNSKLSRCWRIKQYITYK